MADEPGGGEERFLTYRLRLAHHRALAADRAQTGADRAALDWAIFHEVW